jgi:hypothetical protein
MIARDRIWLAAATAILSATTSPASAQVKADITVAQMFGMAKPGQWIRIEGTPQKDQTVMCTKVKILTGAIKDSAWTIRGPLRSIDSAKRELTIGRYRVRLTQKPKYSSPTSAVKGLSDLKPAMLVKVEGIYSNGAGFVARKVNDESEQISGKPGIERQILVQGKIQRADAAKKTIGMMATTFVVTANTRASSEAK